MHSWRAPSPIHLCNSDNFQLLVTHEALMIRRGLFCSKYLESNKEQIGIESFSGAVSWNTKNGTWSKSGAVFLSGLQQGDEHWQCQRCTQDVGKWDPGTWSLQSSGIFVSGTNKYYCFFARNPGWTDFFDILTSGAQRWPHKVGQGCVVSKHNMEDIHLGAKRWDSNHDNLVSIWWFDTFFLDYLFDSVFFRVELHH